MDLKLRGLAKCGTGPRNESRALHGLIHRTGRTLNVAVHSVHTPIKILKGKPRVEVCNYPVLFLSSWVQQILRSGGQMLLGGFRLQDSAGYIAMFSSFWERFRFVRPDLDLYTRQDWDHSMCIPVAYHGDEGRGKLKRPILILAFQPLISFKGMEHINSSGKPDCIQMYSRSLLYPDYIVVDPNSPFMNVLLAASTLGSRHSFTTRMLFTVVPSQYYTTSTVDCLHKALVADWLNLYENGISVDHLAFIFKYTSRLDLVVGLNVS